MEAVTSSILVAFACAIPLASACGERTQDAPRAPRGFAARLEFPTVGWAKPQGLLACDLDGDGRDEVVALANSPGSLQFWSGLSRAVSPAVEAFAISIDDFALGPAWLGGAPPASVNAPATIVFASRAVPGITAVELRAASRSKPGAPLEPTWHVALDRRPRVLASGDLGRDGRPDVVVVTVDDDLVWVRSPTDSVKTRLGYEQATCARVSDDGRAVFVGFQGARRLVRYEFDAAGHAVERASVGLDGLPRAIDEVDAPAGRRTLLVAGGDDRVWTFGAESDAFAAGPTLKSSAVPIALAHGDLARGGSLEHVVLGLHGQEVVVYSGVGSDARELGRAYAGQHPFGAALGDFDGDGRLDLAVSNGDAKRISCLFGSGDGRFDVAPSTPAGRAPHSLAAADLDGDGKLDVVALSALEGTISTLRNQDGALAAREMQGPASSGDAVRCADLDGDGHVDAAFLRRTDKGSVLAACFGDGRGHLFQRAEVAPVGFGRSSGDLLLADVDGDGALEAVASDPDGGRVALVSMRRVPEAGIAFESARAIDVPAGPRSLALVRVPGERIPRVAVALSAPGKRAGVAILRATRDAQGLLALTESAHVSLDAPATGLAVADFDGDGLQDLAVLTSKSESESDVRVLYGTTTGAWTLEGAPLPTGLRPYALRAGDVDGDGRPDLACSAQNSHHVNLWLDLGGRPATFTRAPDLGAGTGPLDVQFADLDGDGWLEILVANSFSNDVSVIRTR